VLSLAFLLKKKKTAQTGKHRYN